MYKETENNMNIVLCEYLQKVQKLTNFDVETKKSLCGKVTVQIKMERINKTIIELRTSILSDGTIGIKMMYPECKTLKTHSIGYDLSYYTLDEMRPFLYTNFIEIEDELVTWISQAVNGIVVGGYLYA